MWTDIVPLISNGQVGNDVTFNTPLQALIDRTAYLKQQLDALTNKSNILAFGVAISNDVVVGDLVYFNKDTRKFEKALAAWSDTFDSNGDLIPSTKSQVRGVIVETTGNATATLLLAGEYTSAAVTARLFTDIGEYYLSATDPGGATKVAPMLKVPVLSYLGGNKFIFTPDIAATPNHSHKAFNLTAGWLDITDPAFNGMEIPGTAVKGYDIASDPELSELFAIYHGEAVVFNDGVLLDSTSVVINKDNIWWMKAATPTGVFVLYTYTPFVRGEPILRTASSATVNELEVLANNGHLQINAKPWVVSPTVTTVPYAIANITDKTLQRTPVITSVNAGPGINVVTTSEGRAVVSQDTSMEALIEADIIDLNNALQFADDPFVFFNMPANRESSILYRVCIPKLTSGVNYKAAAWAMRKGMTGGTVPTPVTYPAITVIMTFVPNPGSGYVDLGTLTTVSTSLTAFSSVQGYLYYHETPASGGRIAVLSEGTLYVKFVMTASAGDKVLSRLGCKIYVES